MKYASLLILVLLIASSFMVPLAIAKAPVTNSSQEYPSVFTAQVDRPSVAYTGQNISIYVNVSYGFQNYNVTVYYAGQNLTGMQPLLTFHQYEYNDSYFHFYMIMPKVPQKLILYVIATATASAGNVSYSTQTEITVESPLVLHAVVKNPTSVPIRDATLTFLIDGSIVSTKVVNLIPAGGSVNVNVSLVLSTPLSTGKHTITVKIDSSVALVNNAGSTYSSTFYYGTPPNFNWIYYVAGAVVIFMAFLAFAAGRRRPSTGPKWKR